MTKTTLHTQFTTGRRSQSYKLTKAQDALHTAMVGAKVDADMYQLPQTVWATSDREAPYMSLVNGSEFRPELRAKPVVTLLPANYFRTAE